MVGIQAVSAPLTHFADEGGPATTETLKASRDMLVALRARVQKLIDDGRSEDEVVAAKHQRLRRQVSASGQLRTKGLNNDFRHANQRIRLRVCQGLAAFRVDLMDERADLIRGGVTSVTLPTREGRFEFHRQRMCQSVRQPIRGDLRHQLVKR
jgi:hypothetical protein